MPTSWDDRYAEPGYAYGTEPNGFLVAKAHLLPVGGRVLCLAEGEGRNSVYLASLGMQVTAVDSSAVGLDKAVKLAEKRGVGIHTVLADLADFQLQPGSFEAIISIFCHLPPPLRRRVHGQVAEALTPGGIFLLEGYTPKQLNYRTGGPPVAELLMEQEVVAQELAGLELLHSQETVRKIVEGRLHTGDGSVLQLVAKKNCKKERR